MQRKIRRHKKKLQKQIARHKTWAGILGILILAAWFFSYKITTTHSEQPKKITMEKEVNLLQGNWNYLPGVRREGKQLIVKPTNLQLIEQNGKPGQLNPPLNVAGTAVASLSGDFALKAQIVVSGDNRALLRLYGRPPVILDEFRIERENIMIEVGKGCLMVSYRNTYGQQSKYPKVFHFTPQTTTKLVVKQLGKVLFFEVNDQIIGSLPDAGMFSSQQLFLGLESKKGEWKLSDLRIVSLNGGTFTVVEGSKVVIKSNTRDGLQALASKKRPGFIVGMSRAINPSFTDKEYQKIAFDKNIFGGLTPENAMKMANLQPQRGVYTFELADALVQAARQNGIQIHGHTLVFGEANPVWFTSLPYETPLARQQIERIMLGHIGTVVTHFKGKVASWDVINEPMADYDDTKDGQGAVLRQHTWYKAMGEDYIIKALEKAHRSDPNVMLFINEYGLEEDGDRWNAFIALMTRIKTQLQQRKIPVEKVSVGFQAHVYEPYDRIRPDILTKHIQQLGKLGFKVQISEMDVYGEYNDTDRTEEQARQYAEVFKACLNERNCVAWRGWILSDRYNYWKDDDGSVYQGTDGLFDKNMQPRPAYKRMLESVK